MNHQIMNHHIFREYDIRGLVGADLNERTVRLIARAVGTYLRQRGGSRVALGYDARESSPAFRDLFAESLNQTGLDVLNIGMVPTPLLYFTIYQEKGDEKVDGGVMITASHNPAEYNGFKISVGRRSLCGDQIQKIKEIALSGEFASGAGVLGEKEVISGYIDFVAKNIRLGRRKLKVVVDAGNGIGGRVAAPLYKGLGCEVIELFTEPDGRFPNHHPDPSVPENMRAAAEAVLKHRADLAIAFDGDADRIGAADEKGNILWGDELLMIFAREILKKNPGASVVAEPKCSQRLFDDIRRRGGRTLMCKAGYSIVKSKMMETGAILAGEMSGHIFFADRYFGFDDAIYAGARLLEILSHCGAPLSAFLADLPPVFSTPEIRIPCPEERKFEVVRQITKEFKRTNEVNEIDGARISFAGGWGLVRPSNTHAVLVLRFEAESRESLENIRKTLETRVCELISQTQNTAF